MDNHNLDKLFALFVRRGLINKYDIHNKKHFDVCFKISPKLRPNRSKEEMVQLVLDYLINPK